MKTTVDAATQGKSRIVTEQTTRTGKPVMFIDSPVTAEDRALIQATVRTRTGLMLWNEPTPKSATRNALEWLGIAAIFALGVAIAFAFVL